MTHRLDGKVALISGAARGQGAAESRLMAAEGAAVVVADVLSSEAQAVAAEIKAAGGKAVAVHLDVTKAADWGRTVALAESTFGKLDILVNNAGILSMAGVLDTTEEEWQRIIAVNQTGVWLGMKHSVPAMQRAGGGSIINISSIYGLIGSGAAAAYQGTKGAVRILSKTAAVEFAPSNIRVNSVHPGIIDTPMIDPLRGGTEQAIAETAPIKRLGRPEEVAWGVVFLASDEASFITGAELAIDGGYTTV